MTDGMTDGQPGRGDTGPDRRMLTIGGGVAAVLLAIIGAAGGWVLAGDQERSVATPPGATGSPTPAGQTSPPRERPTTSTSRTPSSSPTPSAPTGLTVPDLIGLDFEEAREKLRDRGLGWQLVFGSGDSASVRSTNPAPGTPVKRGITVVITVAGAAPPNEVPDLVGETCTDARNELVDAGFSPRYPNGRSGSVTEQRPAGGHVGRWNDVVQIWCGTASSGDESAPES
ncbi:PASTA domain-containing protein [Micromonospora sp. WMMD1082]|uniref:PASTA domain-containing protein n=1 Tax=Micromonospora sp. WMMD1082 TaxID=3016104 RepID=UPI002415F77A|nr:PASTA domain-containing protein [Micromonospora sp. WMMD1082]MDG4794777.1 PASTA domain-containing protein [Micromonospora sp. WMMD1082]